MATENTTEDKHAEIAAAFGRSTDPLAEFEDGFNRLTADPFELFLEEYVEPRGLTDGVEQRYRTAIRYWKKHMEREGRHPACPNANHVKRFIEWRLNEIGNNPKTVRRKVSMLNQMFGYWQNEPTFPHTQDFNPVATAQGKVDLTPPDYKEPPRIPIDELRETVGGIPHIRDRAIVATQVKLGLRATELCNIKLTEIHVTNSELQAHYDELGTHPVLSDRPNAVYIPHDREGNKSERPRVLPLDDELRRILLQYLLVRPDNGQPWVFLSKTTNNQLEKTNVNNPWKEHFHPKYDESERHASVTSHFGRHWFTTFWRVEQDAPRELVKYMRGDKTGEWGNDSGAIDHYIHTWYEDIEPLYREGIFKLRL